MDKTLAFNKSVSFFVKNVHFQVDGQSYKKFTENQSKIMKSWILPVDGVMYRYRNYLVLKF